MRGKERDIIFIKMSVKIYYDPFYFYFYYFFLFFTRGSRKAYDEIFKIQKKSSTWDFKREKEGGKSGAFLRFEMDRHFEEFWK